MGWTFCLVPTGVWYRCWPIWQKWEPRSRPSTRCAASVSSVATRNPSCLKCSRWGIETVACGSWVNQMNSVSCKEKTVASSRLSRWITAGSLLCFKESGGFWVCVVYYFILQLYCPIWISPMRNSGCFPQGKPAVTEPRYPTLGVCWVF